MISDSELLQVYDAGFGTNHLTGLKAVWNAAVAHAKEPAAPAAALLTPKPASTKPPEFV